MSARTPPGTPVGSGACGSLPPTPSGTLPPTPVPRSPWTPLSPLVVSPQTTPEIPSLLLPPAFRPASPCSEPVQPPPFLSQPTAAEAPQSTTYHIPRLAVPTNPTTAAPRRTATAPAQPTTSRLRRTSVLRERETRSGSRLTRLAVAATIPKQRRLWNCRLCSLTLTSAKAKYDHVNGRRHKARVEAQQDHYCGHCKLQFASALDLDRHIKGRRHLKVVSSRNH